MIVAYNEAEQKWMNNETIAVKVDASMHTHTHSSHNRIWLINECPDWQYSIFIGKNSHTNILYTRKHFQIYVLLVNANKHKMRVQE